MINSTSSILTSLNNSATKKVALPEYIHFIWAGGQKLMPETNRQAVIAWAQQNRGFTVYLWVDLQTTSIDKLKEYYRNEKTVNFSGCNNIVLRDINTLQEFNKNNIDDWEFIYNNLTYENEYENAVSSPYVRYEIDRLSPNFGASSDILRYRILYKFGGAYFDSDISPGEASLAELYSQLDIYNSGLLRCGVNSQNEKMIGNDAFICAAGNPIMQQIYKVAEQNYHIEHIKSFDIRIAHVQYFDNEAREDATIKTTGPKIIRQVLQEQKILASPIDLPNEEYQLTDRYYKPFECNTREWVGFKFRNIDDKERAWLVALDTIIFEANTLGFMRFDEHVKHIACMLGIVLYDEHFEQNTEVAEIANQLLEVINNSDKIDTDNIITVHHLSKFPDFVDYYKRLPNIQWTEGEIKWFASELKEIEGDPVRLSNLLLANLPAMLKCLSSNYNEAFKETIADVIHDGQSCNILANNEQWRKIKIQFEDLDKEHTIIRGSENERDAEQPRVFCCQFM